MPIQIYKNKTGATQIRNPYAGTDIPLGALGIESASRQAGLRALANAGQQLIGMAEQQYKKRQEADAFAAYNQLQSDAIEFEASYTSTHQGKDAHNAASDYQQFIDKRSKELGSDLGSYALQSFNQKASGIALNSFASGTRYARQQSDIYDNDVYKGMVATHQQLVAQNPDNYAAIAMSRNQLNQAQKTLFPGRDYISMNADLDKKDATQMINSALASGNIKQATTLYGELSSKLGDDAPAMQVRITSLQESEAKRAAVAEKKAAQAHYDVIVNSTYTAIQDRIDGLPEEDQDILVFHFLDGIENQKMRDDLLDRYEKDKKFHKMRQDAVDEKERSAIFADDTLSPSQRIDAINANENMSPAAKGEAVKSLKEGPAQSDLFQFEVMEERILNPDCPYATTGELRRAMDTLQLTNKDKDDLVKTYTTLQKKQRDNGANTVKQAISNADMTMEALGVPKQDKSAVKMAFIQQVSLLEAEGTKLGQSELDRLMRQLVATKSTGKIGFWGTEEAVVGTAIVDVPFEAQQGIREYLSHTGISSKDITPERVLQEWNRRGMEDFRGDE